LANDFVFALLEADRNHHVAAGSSFLTGSASFAALAQQAGQQASPSSVAPNSSVTSEGSNPVMSRNALWCSRAKALAVRITGFAPWHSAPQRSHSSMVNRVISLFALSVWKWVSPSIRNCWQMAMLMGERTRIGCSLAGYNDSLSLGNDKQEVSGNGNCFGALVNHDSRRAYHRIRDFPTSSFVSCMPDHMRVAHEPACGFPSGEREPSALTRDWSTSDFLSDVLPLLRRLIEREPAFARTLIIARRLLYFHPLEQSSFHHGHVWMGVVAHFLTHAQIICRDRQTFHGEGFDIHSGDLAVQFDREQRHAMDQDFLRLFLALGGDVERLARHGADDAILIERVGEGHCLLPYDQNII
jgi:hypothetical protein